MWLRQRRQGIADKLHFGSMSGLVEYSAHPLEAHVQEIRIDDVGLAVVADLLDASRLKIGQNLKFDQWILTRHGMPLAGPRFDTRVAAYVLDPGRQRYGMVNEHNAWVPRDFWLEDWERAEGFHLEDGLQCEACHGAGRTHAESSSGGYGATGEQTCRSCHTDERNPDFDYETAWGKIKH